MGKKKRNNKQLQLRESREKYETSATAAKAASCQSINAAKSNDGSSDEIDRGEIVYNPRWHRRQQQFGQSNRRPLLGGKSPEPDFEVAGSHGDLNGGVNVGSVKCEAQDKSDVGETAEMLLGLRLGNKSEDICNSSMVPKNRGLIESSRLPRARPVSSSGFSSTKKSEAQIAARKEINNSCMKSRSYIQNAEHPVQQLPIPKPSASYLAQSSKPTSRLATPQPLLVILDLNGTLLRRSKEPRSKWIDPRPNLAEFLAEIIGVPARTATSMSAPPSSKTCSIITRASSVPFSSASFPGYSVMVWSSARPENVRSMCSQILTAQQRSKLVGVWARDRLQLSPAQYAAKLPVYKQLEWIWASNEIGQACLDQTNGLSVDRNDERGASKKSNGDVEKGRTSDKPRINRYWGQHNTVLLDDSALKARAEPYNVIELPEFKGLGKDVSCECTIDVAKKSRTEECEAYQCMPVLRQVQHYLEELSYQRDVSSFIRVKPFIAQKHVGNNDLG